MAIDEKLSSPEENKDNLESKIQEGKNVLKNGSVVYQKKGNKLLYYLGQLFSLPSKLVLLDKKIGSRPSQRTIDYVVKDLEKNPDFSDVTVRLGHGAPFKDTLRLLTDERIKRSTPLLLRVLGMPSTLVGETFAYLTRSDHYNPFTNTAVIYSDVPAVALHELGHANFFNSRKKKAMPYAIAASGIGTLYMEYDASRYAHKALPPYERYQTGRYLFPAFGTYLGNKLGVGPYIGAAAGLAAGAIYSLYNILRLRSKKLK
ncbi:hypothetical protein JXA85_03295 [Candidatus Woesearchaeota archaeon]|nr:hypothetical protein [Candidatus Woesearchaeota archaeon]